MDEGKANANVGAAITASDSDSRDSGKLTYSVDDNTNFSITTGGQLKTKVPLNHETNETFTVEVTATDRSGGADTVNVNVTVTDVNEAPRFGTDSADAGPTRIQDWRENTAITTGVATYTATDPDERRLGLEAERL